MTNEEIKKRAQDLLQIIEEFFNEQGFEGISSFIDSETKLPRIRLTHENGHYQLLVKPSKDYENNLIYELNFTKPEAEHSSKTTTLYLNENNQWKTKIHSKEYNFDRRILEAIYNQE